MDGPGRCCSHPTLRSVFRRHFGNIIVRKIQGYNVCQEQRVLDAIPFRNQ